MEVFRFCGGNLLLHVVDPAVCFLGAQMRRIISLLDVDFE